MDKMISISPKVDMWRIAILNNLMICKKSILINLKTIIKGMM